ncbi:MAG TPA: nucleotidyltransferase family protein [Anaerolineaceae bacterium]|nr:nucleotidyltransferase family protein [Anaerolineaceae bacterium]
MNTIQMEIPHELITDFCQRWKVVEFALFGSILREDFDSTSDVDVLVTFDDENQISLFDLAQMQIELQDIFSRPVDILEKSALRNPFRKRHILETAQVVYETSFTSE